MSVLRARHRLAADATDAAWPRCSTWNGPGSAPHRVGGGTHRVTALATRIGSHRTGFEKAAPYRVDRAIGRRAEAVVGAARRLFHVEQALHPAPLGAAPALPAQAGDPGEPGSGRRVQAPSSPSCSTWNSSALRPGPSMACRFPSSGPRWRAGCGHVRSGAPCCSTWNHRVRCPDGRRPRAELRDTPRAPALAVTFLAGTAARFHVEQWRPIMVGWSTWNDHDGRRRSDTPRSARMAPIPGRGPPQADRRNIRRTVRTASTPNCGGRSTWNVRGASVNNRSAAADPPSWRSPYPRGQDVVGCRPERPPARVDSSHQGEAASRHHHHADPFLFHVEHGEPHSSAHQETAVGGGGGLFRVEPGRRVLHIRGLSCAPRPMFHVEHAWRRRP